MTEKKDALGLTLTDTSDVLGRPPSIMVYAPSGFGKTTAVAQCPIFNKGLWLTHNKQVLRPFAHWMKLNPKEAAARELVMPAVKELPEYVGSPKRENKVDCLNDLIRPIIWRYAEACQNGTCPYTALIIDEFSVLTRRVQDDITRDKAFGRDHFARIKELNAYIDWIGMLPVGTGRPVVLIAHDREPTYHDENAAVEEVGKLKYRGGPELPTGPQRKSICTQVDIVLRGVVKSGGGFGAKSGETRVWRTQPDPKWESKIRAFGLQDEEPLDLYDLLTRAGYRLS